MSKITIDTDSVTPADVVALTQYLKTGAQLDEVRSRLATLYDINSVEGLPEGAVIVAEGQIYRVALDGNIRESVDGEGPAEYPTFSDAIDHLYLALADALIINPGDVPVTYVDMRTGLKVELGRADQLDDMTEPIATKQSNGWTWDARYGHWFAVVDGERRENWAGYNDPPQMPPVVISR